MPRPHEIAADARALYGPLALRPSAQEAGDGALWVDPSAQSPLSHVQSGNWVPLGPAGVPVLRGPYVVDYTDIPHGDDTTVLWTPAVGDILLRLFPDVDPAHLTQWDHGRLVIGQNPDGHHLVSVFDWAGQGGIGYDSTGTGAGYPVGGALDNIASALGQDAVDAGGNTLFVTASIFHSTDPVKIQLDLHHTGDSEPTCGHVELYALVARAVAP